MNSNTTPWLATAIRRIEADYQRSADTHLIALPLPAFAAAGIDLYLKDESTHPTGSLKHRLARSLFLYALVNGWVREGTAIVEASSGSTAVSEAYFARLLGLPFVAVMPQSTSPEKIAQIAFYGGRSHFMTHAGAVYEEARAGARGRRPLHGSMRTLVDRIIEVPNADSIAAMRVLSALLGRKVGPSTGTNFSAMLLLAHEMRAQGRQGSIFSLLCDAAERYLPTYHDAQWVADAFGDCDEVQRRIEAQLT